MSLQLMLIHTQLLTVKPIESTMLSIHVQQACSTVTDWIKDFLVLT